MSPPDDTSDGWKEWSRYVLKELERLNKCYDALDAKVADINSKMTMLQVKVAGISAAASVVTTLVFLILTKVLAR
jgi:hypothetical protein